MYNIESHEPVVQTQIENVLYQICTFVWEHERLVSLLISRADSCCLIAGVWKDRWPLWEREERVLRVEEDLSTSLPLAANTVSSTPPVQAQPTLETFHREWHRHVCRTGLSIYSHSVHIKGLRSCVFMFILKTIGNDGWTCGDPDV